LDRKQHAAAISPSAAETEELIESRTYLVFERQAAEGSQEAFSTSRLAFNLPDLIAIFGIIYAYWMDKIF